MDDLEKGCLIPLGQALATGVLCGAATVGLALWQGWEEPWALGLIAAGLGAGLWWVSSILLWRGALYAELKPIQVQQVESATQAVSSSHTLRLELYQGKQIQFAELPVSFEQARSLASGLLAGQGLTEASWTGSGRPFSRGQFATIRAEFLKRGWARWRNESYPAQGVELSPAGLEVCRQLERGGGK